MEPRTDRGAVVLLAVWLSWGAAAAASPRYIDVRGAAPPGALLLLRAELEEMGFVLRLAPNIPGELAAKGEAAAMLFVSERGVIVELPSRAHGSVTRELVSVPDASPSSWRMAAVRASEIVRAALTSLPPRQETASQPTTERDERRHRFALSLGAGWHLPAGGLSTSAHLLASAHAFPTSFSMVGFYAAWPATSSQLHEPEGNADVTRGLAGLYGGGAWHSSAVDAWLGAGPAVGWMRSRGSAGPPYAERDQVLFLPLLMARAEVRLRLLEHWSFGVSGALGAALHHATVRIHDREVATWGGAVSVLGGAVTYAF